RTPIPTRRSSDLYRGAQAERRDLKGCAEHPPRRLHSKEHTMSTFARRSMLMTPGNRLERMLKAASLGADALVFDLEDSVPPEQKPAARSTVARALQQAADAGKELCVRVNSLGSGHGLAGLQAIPWHLPDSIMIPKVESAQELLRFDHPLGECSGLD